MSQPPADSERVTLAALFAGFFGMGLSGFGGVLPWARRAIVERRRWLTPAEFTDLLALCQFLPGPNIVNLSIALGARFRGLAGAFTCVFGLLAAPFCVVIGLGVVYARYGHLSVVQHTFHGLAAAASGLVLATALKIAAPLWKRPAGMAVAAASFVAQVVLHVPLPLLLLVLIPVSMGLAWYGRRVRA